MKAKCLSGLRDKHRLGECKPLRDARADLPAAFVQAVDKALLNKIAALPNILQVKALEF